MIVDSRRIIGITNIDDFYKLSPREFNDLCRGALLAQYDQMNNMRISTSMVRPVGLIEDAKSQNESVEQALNQFKDFANNFGNDKQPTINKQINAEAFYKLVMERGRE